MTYEFSLADINNIKYLNTQLSLLEQKICDESLYLAQQAFTYRQKNLYDYELELSFTFYTESYNEELISWEEGIPKRELLKKKPNWYINDGKNHNVSSSCWKNNLLNAQHHCWLLHRLYDDFQLSWNDILRIKNILFDIKVSYQYKVKLENRRKNVHDSGN